MRLIFALLLLCSPAWAAPVTCANTPGCGAAMSAIVDALGGPVPTAARVAEGVATADDVAAAKAKLDTIRAWASTQSPDIRKAYMMAISIVARDLDGADREASTNAKRNAPKPQTFPRPQ